MTEHTVGRKHTFRGGAHLTDPGGEEKHGHKCETEGCENIVMKRRTLHCKSCAARARAKRFYESRKTPVMCKIPLCQHKRYGDSEYCIEHSGRCIDCGVVTNFNSKRCPSCAQRQWKQRKKLLQQESSTARINELSRIIATYESSSDPDLRKRAVELHKQLGIEVLCQSLTRLKSQPSGMQDVSPPAIAEPVTHTSNTRNPERKSSSRSRSTSSPRTSVESAAA